ncbi:MAG TPA: endonuclease MutS2 [Candidatus Borkfalkia stercoripullorum]|nr:endonuclease MutS2 [Candidatus Borkfalkia stercoripullorum]
MDRKTIEKLELNKILKAVASFAVLPQTKAALESAMPESEIGEAKYFLDLTSEADLLLFRFGTGRIEAYPEIDDEPERAAKGAALSCGELLSVAALLRSARVAYNGVKSVSDERIVHMREIADRLYFDESLERDIGDKILSEEEVSDFASDALYNIRVSIRRLNERIRGKLSEYLGGNSAKYLQEGIVTMRDNRYVLPVRAEYKSQVRGFVHDRSASGATFFIEPEEVLEMNNELRELAAAEKEEIERILAALSRRVGGMAAQLREDTERLSEMDAAYAKAEYSYKNKCVRPAINDRGVISIEKGRHPLLDAKTAVPVTVSLGKDYRLLLVSGPNTGGKTVTLKMCGLFCLMACCGLFIPAAEGSEAAVFEKVFCDIGDAQSIEENLSTFSSHIKNVIGITEGADEKSLVLIDELGGGTDPDEGQAIAKAVLSFLLKRGCRGIVTTHYTSLKEFAYSEDGIENASMEFDMSTLQPLYKLSPGVPGSSNAIAISRRLGLSEEILRDAVSNLSEGARKFENIVRTAEQSRIEAEEAKRQAERLRAEWEQKLSEVNAEREKLKKEREKLYLSAKVESRRIVNERAEEAEELLKEIENIAAKNELTPADLIRARTLKNKIADKAYGMEFEKDEPERRVPADLATLKAGDKVFVGAMESAGEVVSVNARKKEAEVLVGSIRMNVKAGDLFRIVGGKKKDSPKNEVRVVRNISSNTGAVQTEINLLGMTVSEAIEETDAFIDRAVLAGLEEVKIVHGVGTGKLRDGIREHLRKHKNVAEFRSGKYGEGEAGVTVVKLK